ncbi:MAG: hypothetical protein PHG85_07175, partial [Candidatus Altiarchaeota archaeon]|nr:hypothetical protein [Candidatus Altiarchaeota archaeon]
MAVLVFYNLALVNSETYKEMFTIAPIAGQNGAFRQAEYGEQTLFVYSNVYKYFIMNMGLVNYGSLPYLSGAKPAAIPYTAASYRGEAHLQSGAGNAIITSLAPNRIEVAVSAIDADTLVVNQNHDSGWKDSSGRNVFQKDGLIAVDVPPGNTNVVLYYSPESFKLGAMITLLTVMLSLDYAYLTLAGKGRVTLKKYLARLKGRTFICALIAIIILSTWGVDIVQSAGL